MLVYLDLRSIQRPLDDQTQLRIRVETAAVLGIIALISFDQRQLLRDFGKRAGRDDPARGVYDHVYGHLKTALGLP